MRKGQAAMEFLMTYGWAILVVLAAIGALAYFGVLSPDRLLPSKCTVAPPFTCGEFKADASGLNVAVRNTGGQDLVGVTITATCDAGATGPTGVTFPLSVANGELISGATLVFADAGCQGSAGDRFSTNLNIEYTRAGESLSHNATGSIQTRVE